ncbi:MAG: 4Fe-4S binding protein [Eggerthellaceae bacterium]|jgi:pyruvate ferredoxin oxidoreductase delta subunit|nr:4Fe-4S binding protein [Eggerthellaceae bacterium]MCH4220781.1 4Fe-4S binding protein [Eggerthellaceae bacterium]
MATFDVDSFEDWKPSDFPQGFVCPEAGNSVKYKTGGWRSRRPIWDPEACKNCMLCWVYCPDASIQVKDGAMTGIDLDHCKGCGVCVSECRFGALKMITESEAKEA